MTDRDALADLRAEIHLWTGDESTPVDLRVLRAAAAEITALRARVAELEAAVIELKGLAPGWKLIQAGYPDNMTAALKPSALENDRG